MATILPVQSVFDQEIPLDCGNAEYRQERKLLIAMSDFIVQGGLDRPIIEWFLDGTYVNKILSVFGTNRSAS